MKRSWPANRRRADAETEKNAPGGAAPAAARPFFLLTLLYIFTLGFIAATETQPVTGWRVGEKAPVTVIAAADFSVVDLSQTEIAQTRAQQNAPPVFTISSGPLNSAVRSMNKLFDHLLHIRANPPAQGAKPSHELSRVLDLLGIPLTPDDLSELVQPGNEREMQDVLIAAFRKTWLSGIISAEDRETKFRGITGADHIAIKRTDGSVDDPVPLKQIPTPEEALNHIVEEVQSQLSAEKVPASVLRALLKPWLAPNLSYDPYGTADSRRAAQEAVPPVRMTIRAGTVLAERGDRLTAQQVESLRAHELRQRELESPLERRLRLAGIGGWLAIGMILCVTLTQLLRPRLLHNYSALVLWLALNAMTLFATNGLLRLAALRQFLPASALAFAAPMTFAPLMAVVLLGGRAAWIIGVWTGFATAALYQADVNLLPYSLAVTAAVIHTARTVRKRSQIYRAGAVAGGAAILYVITLGILRQRGVETVLLEAAAGALSALGCALGASLLIPLGEWALGATTDLRLLEFSDLSHPLLQRLALEAPGTYQHSMAVAHLVEAAAARIGANPLLARVGAYFHDVGKLVKPDFYTENLQTDASPHEELAPEMSALLIRSHVREGLMLARRYNLPPQIQEAITQHHGTSLIAFFYRQATESGQPVSEAHFRYEGPKPRRREWALLMLADAAEAAARSLERPTSERLDERIREITDSKIRDGQLDECPLTLAEIREAQQSFVATLANMLHIRVAYPTDENRAGQPTTPTADTTRSMATTDTLVRAASRETRNHTPH